jgi:hypothetical protein
VNLHHSYNRRGFHKDQVRQAVIGGSISGCNVSAPSLHPPEMV